MPLVFTAITPHPPMLMPKVGKAKAAQLAATAEAFKHLEHDLYASKPDAVVIVSAHGTVGDQFNINLAVEYTADFKEFGDLATKLTFKSDPLLAQEVRTGDESGAVVSMVSEAELGHGASIPLHFLTAQLPKVGVVPINQSTADAAAHFKFGGFLHDVFTRSDRRVAFIASADLSHKVTKDAPDGYSPRGKEFDDAVVNLLKAGKLKGLTKIDPKLAAEASQCGLKSLVVLAGLVDHTKYGVEVLSYEAPFGVGHVVARVDD